MENYLLVAVTEKRTKRGDRHVRRGAGGRAVSQLIFEKSVPGRKGVQPAAPDAS